MEETLLGYYEREDEEDMIVDHEGLFEINVEKPWEDGELEDKLFPPGGDGFITSPADVDPRPPIKLKDAEVSPGAPWHLRACVKSLQMCSRKTQET